MQSRQTKDECAVIHLPRTTLPLHRTHTTPRAKHHANVKLLQSGVMTEDLMVNSHGFYYNEWYRGCTVPLDIFAAKTRLVLKKENVT